MYQFTTDPKAPEHLRVYQILRHMILFGELQPGEAVTIHKLAGVVGAGMTPVREAIRQLIAESALQFMGNRRICVPELTLATINELAFARLSLEPKLAYWCAEHITASQIAELDAIDKALNAAVDHGNVQEYLVQNYRFHRAIYSAAKKPQLLSIVERLWLQVGPSMRIICGRIGTQNLPDMHQLAIDALRQNRPDAAEAAISEDIQQGLQTLRSVY